MKVYIINEHIPYGVFIHVIRAKNRNRAKALAKKRMEPDGKIIQTCEISSKGKEGYLFYDGSKNDVRWYNEKNC